jgi:hypothetical protein
MTKRGVKMIDPMAETVQVDWLVVPAEQCPGVEDELRLISCHFRTPHEPWGHSRAFVMPVRVQRSRRRVLFVQQSGLQ